MRSVILAFLFSIPAVTAQAVTIQDNLLDCFGLEFEATLTFEPLTAPNSVTNGVVMRAKRTADTTNGVIYVARLMPGRFKVTATDADSYLTIQVPDNTNTYTLRELATNITTFTYTNLLPYVVLAGSNTTVVTSNKYFIVSSATGTANLGLLTNGVFYVSAAAGSDATGTGSVSAPWQTPTNALARVTNGVIHVTSGQYQFEIGGRDNVHWVIESDVILGSSNILSGPIFTATNGVAFTVSGSGSILATNIALSTTGTGEITLENAFVYPAVNFTNNILGHWREP